MTRLTMFPIEHTNIWEFYQKALACFWTAHEVDLSEDRFDLLTEDEQGFIENILAFFAASDGIVNLNLELNFTKEVDDPETKAFWHFQEAMEDIHSTMYSILIYEYVRDEDRRQKLLNAVNEIPCITKKAEWAFRWIHSVGTVPFAKRLVAFAIVEGIYFSGAFCSIYWLKTKNKMPGLCKSNEFIARDEGMHTEFACMLYDRLVSSGQKLDQSVVHDMVRDAVEIESGFICDSLPCRLIGMNSDMMNQYIRYVADRLVVRLGYDKIYHDKNPFPFMEQISLEGKNNFFEGRTSEYQKAAVMNKSLTREKIFSEAEEF